MSRIRQGGIAFQNAMSGSEFKAMLDRLGYSQARAAEWLRVNEDTVGNWVASDQVPGPACVAVSLAVSIREFSDKWLPSEPRKNRRR